MSETEMNFKMCIPENNKFTKLGTIAMEISKVVTSQKLHSVQVVNSDSLSTFDSFTSCDCECVRYSMRTCDCNFDIWL